MNRSPQIPDDAGHLPDGLALAIGTSGSTGRPKLAMLTSDALRASAESTHERLGGRGQWLLAMPAHHIAGIQVLVRSLVAGTTPVAMDLESGFTAEAFARASAEIASAARAYTALVPTQLVRLLARTDGREALTRYAAVLVGGAAISSRVLAEARNAGVRVVTTYGMSETAGGCVYDGRPLDVSLVQLEGSGRIQLGGATLAEGYLSEPALSATVFVVDDSARRWFRTDDVGHLDPEGALIVDGRIDDLINTGGLTVAPRLVEDALTRLDIVAEAVVVASPDPEWGQVVSAAIVLTAGSSPPTLDDVRDRLRGILPSHALPRRLVTLPELPLRGPGKHDRTAVRRHFNRDR
jgi:o-succinylbenzoate---CoA ligase